MYPLIKSTRIEGEDLRRIRKNAQKAWLGGTSHVRSDRFRQTYGMQDQLVGQLGEFALSRYFGREDEYFTRRETINAKPHEGDGGSDLTGFSIDIKTSMMRRSKDPFRYNLVVRPAERHQDNIYVLGLVKENGFDSALVLLIGYADDRDFLPNLESQGVFAGAYRIAAKELHDLADLKDLTSE